MDSQMKMRQVTFQNFAAGSEDAPIEGIAAYVELGGCYVFTSLTKIPGNRASLAVLKSTVHIIASILQANSRAHHADTLFYEVQTHLGYDHVAEGRYFFHQFYTDIAGASKPGQSEITALTSPVPCPPEVYELFRKQIGEAPRLADEQAEAELASGKYSVFSFSEAMAQGLVPLVVGADTPSLAEQKRQERLPKMHPQAKLLIVDLGDRAHLLAQYGHRFMLWVWLPK